MQTANIILALGGDAGNSVPKYSVTPAEIAVLRLIHGEDSVTDIEPMGEAVDDNGKARTHRAERQRLVETYGKQQDGRFVSPQVDALFPGAAARVFETLDELELPEEFYKAETRVSSKSKPKSKQPEAPAEGDKALDDMTKAELVELAKAEKIDVDASAKKAEIVEAIEKGRSAPAQDDGADDDDGIDEMDDKKNLFG